MKTYNVRCPVCGHLNCDIYLEETDGWMECEMCGQDARIAVPEISASRYGLEGIRYAVFAGSAEKYRLRLDSVWNTEPACMEGDSS